MADETEAPGNESESDGARRWYEALQKLDRLAAIEPIAEALIDDAECFGWESDAMAALRKWLAQPE